MEKQKPWQLYLIIAVLVLTLYNILPTIFYYSQPLNDPINEKRSEQIATGIIGRVNALENDSKSWIESFCHLLNIHPISVELKEHNPKLIEITLKNEQEAETLKRLLPRAAALIPFVPAQLELYPETTEPNKVYVIRQIGVHFNPSEIQELFHFSSKLDASGNPTDLYRKLVYDRVMQLALAFGGESKNAQLTKLILQNSVSSQENDDLLLSLSKEIVEVEKTFGKDHPITKRFFASFSQTSENDFAIQKLIGLMGTLKNKIDTQREKLLQEQKKAEEQNLTLDSSHQHLLSILNNQRQALENASSIIQANLSEFKAGQKPLTAATIQKALVESEQHIQGKTQLIDLNQRNPFIQAIAINWGTDKISLLLYPDVQQIRLREEKTEKANLLKDRLNQLVINDIARASRLADETLTPDEDSFAIAINQLTNTQSFLTLELGYLAEKQSLQLVDQLKNSWFPKHPELQSDLFPIWDYATYKTLKPEDQKLGLVVYAPAIDEQAPPKGFHTSSIYVIARGLENLMQKYRKTPNDPQSKLLLEDVRQLQSILQLMNFIGYAGTPSYGMAPEYSKDYIFELNDYYNNLLKATRENFSVKGSKRFAVLDFTDVEQRLLTQNKIDDRVQEDLLKWREEYNSAQVDINVANRYLVPAPTKNVYWENFKLSFHKYFRGDDRKILKWGLDLSGGKTVRIGLRDHNNRTVTNPDDLKQAVNELYTRINKMGVSERTIHIEGHNIILDFPGSQNMSATDLVKASAMYFHIVNEKFTPNNPNLREVVNQFLQNVWNEAVVTNRKDLYSINEIAWKHLGGDSLTEGNLQPRSESAKILYDQGLRIANPRETQKTSAFNDTISEIGMMGGEDFTEWDGQSHPLLIIFHNYALEGSSLTNIQVGYDPSEGNILTFNVKSAYEGTHDRNSGNPRDDFYNWTSQFSEDRIIGTPKETYSQGHGWRMAVVLNDTIISKPTLRAALRDGATISGRFSQREVNQLAADLKAGSLSFTPRILSEDNVSPELGKEERTKGIFASIISLVLVVVAMIGYYRFAGLVASCAVLLNILIMWGVLQNIGSALSLPGIAGIVLTIGMAVDANVLVFERIREEFNLTGRIGSAIQAGYRKAFSAIIDSNITTIIAALILIQFDSGPIKGFAVTLIIGIVSSMFTALFMTRYFFAGWVQNPKNKQLTMCKFIDQTNFDFLGQAKKAIIISLLVMGIGTYFFLSQTKTMFGMDFTGGYSLIVELQEKNVKPSYRIETMEALLTHGAASNDIQIRELSKPNILRIQLGVSMEEKGHPFYQLPESYLEGQYTYKYQKNPRIVWLVDALADRGLQIQKSELENLDKHWTVISGQFSEAMRNNALFGLTIALVSILLYITFRFEFKFAVGAVVGLAHDVLITIGILAIFHKIGLPVQIDLQVIGAIMTIIGYSLNDTIIVFDRIREDMKILRKLKFKEIVNHALNVTLSRTIMTSGTTLLVLLALVLFGGQSIFSFSLVMTIGVIVGTLSSLFIASPVMLYLHNKEIEHKEKEFNLKKA